MAAKVAVVVVNWNGERFLRGCLGSLARQTEQDRDVYLVDNGSSDGSVDLVTREFPWVRLLRNPRNLGFATANNQAIAASESEYVALLNNDTEVEPDWLARMLEAMEPDQSVGACASLMVFAHAPDTINSTGIAIDRAGIAWDRWGGRPVADDEGRVVEVFGACAGAALYRRALFADVGLFDEDFFAYLEDVDLSWRARLRGWRCLYVPGARVLHHHSGTSKEGSPFKNYLLGRNKVWTVIKNYQTPALFKYLPAILFFDLGSIQFSVVFRGDLSPLRGRLAAFCGLRKLLAKRRAIQRRAHVPFATIAPLVEPLARPDQVWGRYRHLKALRRAMEGQSRP